MEEILRIAQPDPQLELVARYCREAGDLLAGTLDSVSAARVRDTLCDRFARECQSPLVVHAAREFMTHLIHRRWPESPREDDPANDQH